MQTGLKNASKQFSDFEAKAKGHIRGVESAWGKLSNSNFSQGFLSGAGIQRGQGLDALAGGAVANLVTGAISQGIEKMKDLTARGMEYYDTVRLTTFAFTNLLGSQEKAKQHVAELLQFARATPFDDVPVIQYAQELEAVGIKAEKVTTVLTAMGNALVASGRWNLQSQQGLMLGVTQELGSPTLRMQEITTQIRNYIPTIMKDWSEALGLSIGDFRAKVEAGAIKTMPAFELLVDYYNKTKKGGLEFAGEQTTEGLMSSKRSAEARGMANIIAGGDVLNPKDGAGSRYLQFLKDEIARRDEFAKGGPTQDAVGALATAYIKAREQDDAAIFTLAGSKGAGGVAGLVPGTVEKMNQGAQPGIALGQTMATKVFGEKFMENGGLVGWAKSLFTGATGSAIDTVEQGKEPMSQAGATLGDSLIKGIKSPAGLDSQSPSKKAIAEGLNVRMGFAQGLLDSSVDVQGAGLALANEAFLGIRGMAGTSERQYLEQVGKNPTVKAFFEAIKKAEGGAPDVMAGGRRVASGALHPGEVVPQSQWFRTSKGPSSAAGDWQITRTNWRNLTPALGLNNFSDEHQQYIAALKLFADRGGLGPLLSGDIKGAMGIAAKDWTSTPGSTIGGGGQKKFSTWMSYFTNALNGRATMESSAPSITTSTPLPVQIVDFGNASAFNPRTMGVAKDFSGAQAIFGTKSKPIRHTINDSIPVDAGTIGGGFDPLTTSTEALTMTINERGIKPLEKLGDALTAATTATAGLAGLSQEEVDKKRKEALGEGKAKKAKKDKLFDSAFTKEGVAGDFQGGLQSLLSGLGHDKPTNLLKQFGLGMLQDIQNRLSHDFSSMITGALFGGRGGPDQPMTGGILSKLFGSLFGGHRASGGGMSAGRMYIAGENGPEAIMMGQNGYAYNARETRGMMSGDGRQEIYLAIGDRALGEATDRWHSQPRGRRSKFMTAKYGRKVYAGY